MTAEAAPDVEDHLVAKVVDRDGTAEIAREMRAPLVRHLRSGRPEIEPLPREALEGVRERIAGRGRRGEELRVPGEEVGMAGAERSEQVRGEESRDAVDDRELAGACLAGELALEDVCSLASECDGTERAPAARTDDELEETLPHATTTKSDVGRQ